MIKKFRQKTSAGKSRMPPLVEKIACALKVNVKQNSTPVSPTKATESRIWEACLDP
jgi:hypothetical protein